MQLEQILALGAIILGWTIFGCVCSYAIPQFIKIIKTKNTASMTVIAYIAFIMSSALMGSWGIGNAIRSMQDRPDSTMWAWLSLVPNILTNVLNVTVNAISFTIKLHHLKLCKQYHINEMQLAERLLKAKHERRR